VIPVRQGRASASLHIEQDINQAFETFNGGLSSLPEVLHVTLKAMCRVGHNLYRRLHGAEEEVSLHERRRTVCASARRAVS
jgi:hypothetical protein